MARKRSLWAEIRHTVATSDENLPLLFGVVLGTFFAFGGLTLVLEAIVRGPAA